MAKKSYKSDYEKVEKWAETIHPDVNKTMSRNECRMAALVEYALFEGQNDRFEFCARADKFIRRMKGAASRTRKEKVQQGEKEITNVLFTESALKWQKYYAYAKMVHEQIHAYAQMSRGKTSLMVGITNDVIINTEVAELRKKAAALWCNLYAKHAATNHQTMPVGMYEGKDAILVATKDELMQCLDGNNGGFAFKKLGAYALKVSEGKIDKEAELKALKGHKANTVKEKRSTKNAKKAA